MMKSVQHNIDECKKHLNSIRDYDYTEHHVDALHSAVIALLKAVENMSAHVAVNSTELDLMRENESSR